MKHKLIVSLTISAALIFSLGATRQSDEIKRMGIFISNFTEAGLYQFDLNSDGDSKSAHFGDPAFNSELIKFGIMHNVINNPNSTIKRCPDRRCEYGHHIISGKSVNASIRKYFDLTVRNRSDEDAIPELYYDGRNYHIEGPDWRPETVYYADVQEYTYRRGIYTMTGELYNLHNKHDRPATFTATAKSHVWNDRDTWSILSLNVNWR